MQRNSCTWLPTQVRHVIVSAVGVLALSPTLAMLSLKSDCCLFEKWLMALIFLQVLHLVLRQL